MKKPIGELRYSHTAVIFIDEPNREDSYRMVDVGDWYQDSSGEKFVFMDLQTAQKYSWHPDLIGKILVPRKKTQE